MITLSPLAATALPKRSCAASSLAVRSGVSSVHAPALPVKTYAAPAWLLVPTWCWIAPTTTVPAFTATE
jgi:hypothetical protein